MNLHDNRRLPYNPPKVTLLGSLHDLTQGVAGPNSDIIASVVTPRA